MSWLLQWVVPDFIQNKNDIDQNDIQLSFQHLQNIVKKHVEQIKGVYVWMHMNPRFSSRELLKIQKLLEQRLQNLVNKNVVVFTITRSKNSSLDDIAIRVNRLMHLLCIHEPLNEVVLVSGKINSPLQQAVLIEGIRTSDERFCLLIYDEETNEIVIKHFNESPYRKSWLKLFQHFLHDYDYVGAMELFNGLEMNDNIRYILLLLEVQNARMNFSFQEAYEKFQQVKQLKPMNLPLMQTELILQNLIGDNGTQVKELEQIQELYRHIRVMLLKEDFPSFLTRFYRVREALLNYIVKYGSTEKIEFTHYSSIYQFIEKVEHLYETEKINEYFGVYFYIKSANVADTMAIRNKSFIGHNRQPINRKSIFEEYYGAKPFKKSQATDRFLGDTRIMLRDLGVSMDENLEEMNTYLQELMVNVAREGDVKVD